MPRLKKRKLNRNTKTLSKKQAADLCSAIDDVSVFFHPMSQPFLTLIGIKRILRGRNARTSLPEKGYVRLL